MEWWEKIILFAASIILGAVLTLFANIAFAETNTISSTVTGTTTVDKTPPTASAPSIVINNQDVCTSASSVAVQTQILGFATGQTVTDENCERLKLARSLYGMGMKVAAVSVLCQDERVWEGMWMAGTPCPYLGTIGKAATEAWKDNDYQAPTIESLQKEKVKEVKEEKKKVIKPQEGSNVDKKGLSIFGGLAVLLFLL
tara:strand:- start:902 stop:1498 length:597 start_codon:yes stop_codon:yes gene_type:complete